MRSRSLDLGVPVQAVGEAAAAAALDADADEGVFDHTLVVHDLADFLGCGFAECD